MPHWMSRCQSFIINNSHVYRLSGDRGWIVWIISDRVECTIDQSTCMITENCHLDPPRDVKRCIGWIWETRVKWLMPSTSGTIQSSWADIKSQTHWIAVYLQSMSTKWVAYIHRKWKKWDAVWWYGRVWHTCMYKHKQRKCSPTPIPMTIKAASAILFYVFFTFPHLNVSNCPFKMMPKAAMMDSTFFDQWSTKKRDGNTQGDLPSFKKDIPPLQIRYQNPRPNRACCKGLLLTFSYNTRLEKQGCLHYHRRCVQRVCEDAMPGCMSKRMLYSRSPMVCGIYSYIWMLMDMTR